MSLPILYSFRRCPYAMRARMMLAYSGIAVEHREVDLKNKPQALLTASPKGTVPVLVLANGDVIDESLDVMDYALSQRDDDDLKQRRDDTYINAIQAKFVPVLMRYKYPERYADEQIDHEAIKKNVSEYLAELDQRLAQGFIHGSELGYTDVAIFPFVRQCRIVDDAWFEQLPYTHVHNWLDYLLNSDMYIHAMHKHDIWIPDTLA